MKRYDVELGDAVATADIGQYPWPLVERDDGDWTEAEYAAELEHENVALKRRLRTVTQMLVEELGAEGPISAEVATCKAIQALREADDTSAKLRMERVDLERNIGDAIDALSAAAGIGRPAYIGDDVQGAVDTIYRLKEENRRLTCGEREEGE